LNTLKYIRQKGTFDRSFRIKARITLMFGLLSYLIKLIYEMFLYILFGLFLIFPLIEILIGSYKKENIIDRIIKFNYEKIEFLNLFKKYYKSSAKN
jgi:hypothetical protein